MTMNDEICVLGGGAAGILAAISAAREGASVLLLETNSDIGKKLLATGNGRCNFSNAIFETGCYYGASSSFVDAIFHQFGPKDLLHLFDDIGLFYANEGGYYYPRSKRAASVVANLNEELKRYHVRTICNFKVQKLSFQDDTFIIRSADQKEVCAKRVILALGGKSSQISGSNGDGYYLAEQFGHHIKPLSPALVALDSDDEICALLSGVRTRVNATLYIDDVPVRSEIGELQGTSYGLSGIVMFQLSRLVSQEESRHPKMEISLDFLPEYESEALFTALHEGTIAESDADFYQKMRSLLSDAVLDAIFSRLSMKKDLLCRDLSEEEQRAFCAAAKHFVVSIKGAHGYEMAQTTAGGIDTTEISSHMESRLQKGLYFAGEIVDVDGICGGYNLQWAFSSGYVAGRAAAKELYD